METSAGVSPFLSPLVFIGALDSRAAILGLGHAQPRPHLRPRSGRLRPRFKVA